MFDLARWFAAELDAAPDFELAVDPQANIVCFRYVPEHEADLDALQLEIRDRIVSTGAFYLVRTRLHDRIYLRTTIINPRTDTTDLHALMRAIRDAADRSAH